MATSTPMSCARPGGARRRPASAPIASAAQFQRDMERVQQYIRQHAQLDDKDAAALLGVGDARSRQCYDEIQAFLLRKLQLEQARAAAPVASPASDRFLLRDLDDYLDELDPALFDGAATPKSPAALRLGAALSVPPAASYIRRAQEDAKSGQLQQAASFQQPRPTHALARMRSLLKQQPAAVSYTTKDNSFFRFLERRGAVNSVKPPNETENPLRQADFLRPPTRMGQSENPAPPAAAMRSAAPLPPPPARPGDLQRKGAPPSKDAWLNAIMSKSRAQEASTGTWSPAAAGQAWGQQRAAYREQRPSMAAQEMAPRTDRDGFEAKQERPTSGQQREWMERACAQQVRLDEHALRKAFTIAAQEMVIEQDCCFIAKGLCHLCGVSENHFVPVVNFCPDGNPGHSLCREHLRSIYRVRTEDLFAGKNRPMASRRALKCMVCSMSCPCSMCVHEKNHEINRYHRLLLEEHERSTGGNRNAEGRSAYFSNRRAANEDPGVLESPGDDDARESYPAETHLSMEAEEKVSTSMSMEIRTPKRAAKEGVPQLVLTPREHPSPSSSRDVMQYLEEDNRSRRGPDSTAVPSPSAAHVMNCAESEKSLVELLTTLNQSAGQGTPEDNRRQRYSESTEARRGGPYEDNDSDTRKRELEVNTRLANEDSESPSRPPSRQSGRAAKRKRESEDRYTEEDENDEEEDEEDNGEADEDDDDDDDDDGGYELVESPGGTLTSSRSRKVVRKQHRENYSSEDDAPLRPPRSNIVKVRPGKKPVRGPKQPRSKGNGSDDDRGPKRPSPASRKRKSSSAELERASSQDRKNPRNQKSPASKPPHASKKPSERAKSRRHDSSDDDSDIDTNLDYCEVCSRMGDLVCCDVCPRSFHLSCLGMKERDLPEGDWQCAECKKPSHFVGFARKVESQPSAFAKCMQIVKCLRGHPFAKSFLKPVEDVPNYKDIVDQPMDLSTVMSKLKRNAYAVGNGTKGLNLDAFADDIRLIWANCKLFNDDGSGITRAADELAAGFENLLNLVKKKKTPPPASPDSPPKSADVENQSVNQATPDKPSPVDSVSPESEKEKSPASDDKVAPKPVEKEDRAESPKPDPSDANDSKLNIVAQPNSDTAPENDKKTEAATAEKTESPSDNVKD